MVSLAEEATVVYCALVGFGMLKYRYASEG